MAANLKQDPTGAFSQILSFHLHIDHMYLDLVTSIPEIMSGTRIKVFQKDYTFSLRLSSHIKTTCVHHN
jgi:hypothetical protein